MFSRTIVTARTSALRITKRGYADEKNVMEKAGDALKKTAHAFSKEGSIGGQFQPEGNVGQVGEAVGGPFSAKQGGSIGKEFTDKGAVGGKVQEKSDKAWDKGKEVKSES